MTALLHAARKRTTLSLFDRMGRLVVLADRLACLCLVALVGTAKTAREIHVPDVVRGAELDVHLREHIPQVYLSCPKDRLFDVLTARRVNRLI